MSRIIQAVQKAETFNQKIIESMFTLWIMEDYKAVKDFINSAPDDMPRLLRDGVASRLEGVKREAFLNYMLV